MLYQIEKLNYSNNNNNNNNNNSNNNNNNNNCFCLFVHFLQGATVAFKLKLQKHFDVNEVASEC